LYRKLEKAERRTALSSVSTGIIPMAKKAARINAACIPRVAEANADKVIAEIWVAVSNPSPNTNPVINEDLNGPSIPVLSKILPARIADPVFPHLFIEYMLTAPIVAKAMTPIIPPQKERTSTFVTLPIVKMIKIITARTEIICPMLNPAPTHLALFAALCSLTRLSIAVI